MSTIAKLLGIGPQAGHRRVLASRMTFAVAIFCLAGIGLPRLLGLSGSTLGLWTLASECALMAAFALLLKRPRK